MHKCGGPTIMQPISWFTQYTILASRKWLRVTWNDNVIQRKRQYSILNIVDDVLPRYQFGSSIYSTPVLCVLRFFYGAASFKNMHMGTAAEIQSFGRRTSAIGIFSTISVSTACDVSSKFSSTQSLTSQDQPTSRLSTTKWTSRIANDPSSSVHRLVSLTWVKALASNLTHEYIQFVIVDPKTNKRQRLITDRQESGDYVIEGHDWASTSQPEPSQSHRLPLPLLSLSFEHLSDDHKPSLSEFAKITLKVSSSQPEYDAMKYMCWWYAEAILGTTLAKHKGILIEWEFAKLRYSLVVRTNLIKRKKLTRSAEGFRALNATTLMY